MKTFGHTQPKVIEYSYKAVPHKSVCKPTGHCRKCGRPICYGCTSGRVGHVGQCIICSGQYKEENIILHQPPE